MKYLLVGGSGSWGNELAKQLLECTNNIITIFSRNEANQVAMQRKFANNRLKFIIGDVRDYEAVYSACENQDVVYLLSAIKHVPIAEEQPEEAIKTNINGTLNVIRATIAQKVRKVIDVSTDKACSPNNLYGMTKAVGEKLILNANKKSTTQFILVRAGNVLATAGSCVPLFIEQIKRDNCIRVTNPLMTRFFMTLPEAISLLLVAETSNNADMFVMRMPSCFIGDLAEAMKSKYGNESTTIIVTGSRPGEKMHELLLSEHETPNTYYFDDNYYMVSEHPNAYEKVNFKEYGSNTQPLMNHQEILTMLGKGGF